MIGRPPEHGGPLADAPDEPALQPAGVAAVPLGVAGGDDVVEPERIGQRPHQVGGRGGGQHQRPAFGPVGGQDVEGPGLDQFDQRLDGPLPGPAGRLGRPVAHDPGRRPGQPDEGHRLAESVVEAVHEAVAGEPVPGGQHPLGHHGLLEHRATGRARSACGRGRRTRLRWRRTCPHATAGSRPTEACPGGTPDHAARPGRTASGQGVLPPDAAKGPPGGDRRSLCTDTTRIGGGFL